MAGYTDQEITDAVSSFVRNSISVKRDVLGPIDVGYKFDETIQLISSTLIFDPNAIYYLVYLSSNRLNAMVASAIATVSDLMEAISEMGKATKAVEKTSLLSDASSALLSIDTILTQNTAVSNAAMNRYITAVDSFRDASLKPNIKKGTTIVRPPQEARIAARTDLSTLASTYPSILEHEARLLTILAQFRALNLPTLTVQDSIRKARADLISLQKTFENPAISQDSKIALTRSAYLSITAGKSVLMNLTTVRDPSFPRMQSTADVRGRAGVGTVVPAIMVSGVGPYAVETGVNDVLVIAEDGNAPTTYTLVPSQKALLQNYLPGPFTLVADTAASVVGTAVGPFSIQTSPNNQFIVLVDGVARIASLTPGSRTTGQICQDINTAIGAYVLASNVANSIVITHLVAGDRSLVIGEIEPNDHPVNGPLGFVAGQSSVGLGANNVIEIDGTPFVFAPGTKTNAELAAEFTLVGYSASCVDDFLVITKNAVGEQTITATASSDAVKRAYTLLGFYVGQYDSTRSLSAAEVVDQINSVDKVTARVAHRVLGGVTQEYFEIVSKKSDLTTMLTVSVGSANSTLGLVPGSVRGTTSGFIVSAGNKDKSFIEADVVVGDLVFIAGDSYSVVSVQDKQLDITPSISTDPTARYDFTIVSLSYLLYEDFAGSIRLWDKALSSSDFRVDTRELDRVMNSLLSNKSPSRGQIADAYLVADRLLALLSSLSALLVLFVIKSVPRIDAVMTTLIERSMDRAYDALLDGRLTDLFSMSKDDTASSAYMLKTSRAVVQNDLQMSKTDQNHDDTIPDGITIVTTDAGYDYSDQDREDSRVLLGSVPSSV